MDLTPEVTLGTGTHTGAAASPGARPASWRFAHVEAAFALACRAAPVSWQADCTFAGLGARIRVVGERLSVQMSRAFSHLTGPALPSPSTTSPLTIDLWDEFETGVPAPPPPDVGPASSWGAGGGVLRSVDDGRVVGHRLGHTSLWFEREAQRLVGSVTSADDLSLSERGKPLHYLLSLWHNDRGTFVIHGGLVSRDGRGVLLAGAGGSGKSSSALACVDGGFEYLGDDCVALEARPDGTFAGHSLYSGAWIDPGHLEWFPTLAEQALPPGRGEEKALVLLSHARPERLARTTQICAIALPRVTGTATASVRPASQRDALLALAPSSLVLFAPSPGAVGMRRLGQLVRSLPAYWLDVGTDMPSIPRALEGILDKRTRFDTTVR
jgi:hypothetical protein